MEIDGWENNYQDSQHESIPRFQEFHSPVISL